MVKAPRSITRTRQKLNNQKGDSTTSEMLPVSSTSSMSTMPHATWDLAAVTSTMWGKTSSTYLDIETYRKMHRYQLDKTCLKAAITVPVEGIQQVSTGNEWKKMSLVMFNLLPSWQVGIRRFSDQNPPWYRPTLGFAATLLWTTEDLCKPVKTGYK